MQSVRYAYHFIGASCFMHRSHFFLYSFRWHLDNLLFFYVRKSEICTQAGAFVPLCFAAVKSNALQINGHFNWYAQVCIKCTHYYCFCFLLVFFFFVAFLAWIYDRLNKFAELIVKTFMCHFKLHIKIKQNAFTFPIWRRFVHTFYAFDNSQETMCLRRVKILNLCLTSIKYETFIWISIAFLPSLGIKWQHLILPKGKVTD